MCNDNWNDGENLNGTKMVWFKKASGSYLAKGPEKGHKLTDTIILSRFLMVDDEHLHQEDAEALLSGIDEIWWFNFLKVE